MLQGKGKQNPHSAPIEVWPSHSGTSPEREEIQTPGKLTRKGGKGKREPKAGELLQRLPDFHLYKICAGQCGE